MPALGGLNMAGTSNPVGGETPVEDLSGLIPRGISTRAQLAVAEAQNILSAVIKYLAATPSRELAPFDLPWSLRLHGEMFGDVWSWAGQPRQTELNLGSPAWRAGSDLQLLLDDFAAWRTFGTYDPVERAARLHHRAVQIHPFLNGNGRWSRMLANIALKQDAGQVVRWPEQAVGGESVIRGAYLAALRAADDHDYASLVELHRRYAVG